MEGPDITRDWELLPKVFFISTMLFIKIIIFNGRKPLKYDQTFFPYLYIDYTLYISWLRPTGPSV
ncbi:MAG: hypothetical protein DHS20C17_00380 [Cyclobacteriaceae bacterium]|nr:MAG: hypothetical protein DHS20C17_00380 [Cyclobacteriaceae bacterium]